MNEKKKIPSLYEWAGGMQTFERLTKLFYQKVLQDDLLEPVFKHMSPEHQQRVAHFIAEVFGGPKTYSSEDGSHYAMIQKHLSKRLTEDQRKRWIRLLLETADEINLPDDPEFRSAFVAYIEWGTRIAVNNSNTDELLMNPNEPMPKWGWGVPGGPYLPE
ncbi:globin, protozoan/cyanobacterial family [Leptospira broomii serovar Hurstbridge str. 5399]|uniref:Globin, protozoan/cyanobacterial family n=1 Tax=Leptospira broomii serovar Hurstbridge str. 5399 TaxID=1049789 RepID=T0GFP2_9LEPT|nr:group II truncated hemoglobin [Leptospira broomii]EQA45644.1 globin, protozoan/cyanobacterial family [Leptospira broomii serovar Hurstbridge str. 5399]